MIMVISLDCILSSSYSAALVSLKNAEDVKILTEKDRAIEDLQKTIDELVCE